MTKHNIRYNCAGDCEEIDEGVRVKQVFVSVVFALPLLCFAFNVFTTKQISFDSVMV